MARNIFFLDLEAGGARGCMKYLHHPVTFKVGSGPESFLPLAL